MKEKTEQKTFTWFLPSDGGMLERAVTERMKGACPLCLRDAVVALPPTLLALQPDATTHVCHPILGGCNHGFEDTRKKAE